MGAKKGESRGKDTNPNLSIRAEARRPLFPMQPKEGM